MNWTLITVHKICIYLLAFIAFAALWLGNTFSLPIALFFLLAGLVSWFWEPPRIQFSRYASVWMPLSVSLLVILAVLVIARWLNPFEAGIGLVLYLAAAKLFQRERAADYVQAMVLSFLMMSISTVFNEDIGFGFLFIAYVIVGLISLTLYHLRIQTETHAQAAIQARTIKPRFVGGLALVAMMAIVASVAFFFLFPRVGFGFLAQQTRPAAITTGFNEEVNLGSFGTLKSDPTVVMRVEFPDRTPTETQRLYWRGVSLDRYDGVRWLRTLNRNLILRSDPQSRFDLTRANFRLNQHNRPQSLASGSELRQKIYLEPLDSTALFALSPVLKLSLDSRIGGQLNQPRIQQIGLGENGDVSHRFNKRISFQYEVVSGEFTPNPSRLRPMSRAEMVAELDPEQIKAYTQLPALLDPRIRILAAQVTQGLNSDYDRVNALRRYLLQNFGYTVELPNPGTDPLANFLFVNKRGHCEYFSTALAILLRSIDIPARPVNGFVGGRWNAAERYLAIRNADAHSWVEVPFGSEGWLTVEATPPASNVSNQSSWLDPIRSAYDSLRFRWLKYVIQYNLDTQMELLQQATSTLNNRSGDLKPWDLRQVWSEIRALLQQNLLPLAITLASSFGSGWLGRQRRRQRIRWRDGLMVLAFSGVSGSAMGLLWQPQINLIWLTLAVMLPSLAFLAMRWYVPKISTDPVGISRLYVQLRGSLRDAGLPVQPQQGPEAMIGLLQHTHLLQADRAIQLIRRYMEVRFGHAPLDPQELNRLRQELNQLQQVWKAGSGMGSR